LDIILDELGQASIEKYATGRLNECHSDPLHGRGHVEVSREYGEEQVCHALRIIFHFLNLYIRQQLDPEFVDFPTSE
jgi:bisphosphoglycerate-dependent phosphoglycerate mutase